jgi:molybdate transport system substrate-binding protein
LQVSATFGSSGNFFTQIQNGAPFDVFLSADIEYPRRLVEAGFAQRGTLVRYAEGRLVLWTRRDSGVDVTPGLRALADARVRRIAIANPEHAPYGRAAVAALRREGLYDRVRPRLVLGENILQAAQFAHSGNADAGIIALSLAVGPSLRALGTYAEIPASLHPPIEQGAVVLESARDRQAARRFLAFLQQPESADFLKEHGLESNER